MSQVEEFKKFVTTIPDIRNDVLSGRYTWQQLYEIYVMYGKDDKFWNVYKKSSTGLDLSMVLELAKHIDLETVSASMQSLEKMLTMASSFFAKNEPEKQQKQPRRRWYDG